MPASNGSITDSYGDWDQEPDYIAACQTQMLPGSPTSYGISHPESWLLQDGKLIWPQTSLTQLETSLLMLLISKLGKALPRLHQICLH